MYVPRATAQTRAMTPCSMLGGRGGICIRADRSRGPPHTPQSGADRTKKFAEPVAVSSTAPLDFPIRPLRAAPYYLSVLLRPTPAPCSAQEGMYGLSGPGARVPKHEKRAICER